MMKYLIALSLAFGLLTIAMPTTVFAANDSAEQRQKLEQKFEVECTAGNYGNNTCKVLGVQTGEQYQKIALRNGIKPHKPADTALDLPALIALGGIATTGAGALYLRNKLK